MRSCVNGIEEFDMLMNTRFVYRKVRLDRQSLSVNTTLITVKILAYYMLKYPLMCATA